MLVIIQHTSSNVPLSAFSLNLTLILSLSSQHTAPNFTRHTALHPDLHHRSILLIVSRHSTPLPSTPAPECNIQSTLRAPFVPNMYVTLTSAPRMTNPPLIRPLSYPNQLHLASSSRRNSLISTRISNILSLILPRSFRSLGLNLDSSARMLGSPPQSPDFLEVHGPRAGTLQTPHSSLPSILMFTMSFKWKFVLNSARRRVCPDPHPLSPSLLTASPSTTFIKCSL